MNYWLFKSEPDTFSVDDLGRAKNATTAWDGVRNYQVRNMMRDQMRVGDQGFFYHSSCDVPGIYGVVRITRAGYPERAALDPQASVLRSGQRPGATSLVQRRRASRAAHRPADHARNLAQTCARSTLRDADPASWQPSLGDAGDARRVALRALARVSECRESQHERIATRASRATRHSHLRRRRNGNS